MTSVAGSLGTASAVRFTPGRATLVLGGLLVLLLLAFVASLALGEYPVQLARAFAEPGSPDGRVLFGLRIPRAVLGALVGASLAASGSALQALLRNPLADSFVLGVSGGAALGATLALALGLQALAAPSVFAFVGAVAAMALVLAAGRARSSPYAALLTGVVFNAFAAAIITCIKTLLTPDRLGEVLYWLAGSLGYERPRTLILGGVLQLVALGLLWAASARLNLLSLGDDEAASLGVPVRRTRAIVLVATSLSVAGAVALAGLIGFVGLIVPHLLRLWLGPDQRLLVPASALGGAAFLVLADAATRVLFPVFHSEPPVGVVTAVLGGPLFVWLLNRGEHPA
ncbi:MAG TPA: iron ABC transporter permease [Myxococcaceae bacterium]|jgi:iron complex transport system permease protein